MHKRAREHEILVEAEKHLKWHKEYGSKVRTRKAYMGRKCVYRIYLFVEGRWLYYYSVVGKKSL